MVGTNKSSEENTQPVKREIGSADDVLNHLIFPFLDFKDILQPICTRWSILANSNSLWAPLYRYHFGSAYDHWSSPLSHPSDVVSVTRDWKMIFRSSFVARYSVKGQTNDFGWPVRVCPTIGCDKELRSSFEYDRHMLKHEEEYCSNRIKLLKKTKQRRNRMHMKRRKKK
mmetsp:Transcript_2795/g.7068  ORF Transcript_2795/g.7068 Transcript_2795/m.7068 type:complete len:170 (-) Transcript_2795:2731-3240(-)